MPRGQLTKNEMKIFLLKCKHDLCQESINYTSDPKALAHKYLNRVLEKMDEFAH